MKPKKITRKKEKKVEINQKELIELVDIMGKVITYVKTSELEKDILRLKNKIMYWIIVVLSAVIIGLILTK